MSRLLHSRLERSRSPMVGWLASGFARDGVCRGMIGFGGLGACFGRDYLTYLCLVTPRIGSGSVDPFGHPGSVSLPDVSIAVASLPYLDEASPVALEPFFSVLVTLPQTQAPHNASSLGHGASSTDSQPLSGRPDLVDQTRDAETIVHTPRLPECIINHLGLR